MKSSTLQHFALTPFIGKHPYGHVSKPPFPALAQIIASISWTRKWPWNTIPATAWRRLLSSSCRGHCCHTAAAPLSHCGCQHNLIHINTHKYTLVHISKHQYTSVHINTHHYKSVHTSTHQYTSAHISTPHH